MDTLLTSEFKGLTNDEFLRHAQLILIASKFLQDAKTAHPIDFLDFINKTVAPKKYSQADLDNTMDMVNSGQLIIILKQEAESRGIHDLNKAIGQLNYQANYQDALDALINRKKTSIKTVIMKYVLPTLIFAGLAYLGYVAYVRYAKPAMAKA